MQKNFMNSPGRFFHYEPLSMSFIRLWRDLSGKSLIMPEAARIQETKQLQIVIFTLINRKQEECNGKSH